MAPTCVVRQPLTTTEALVLLLLLVSGAGYLTGQQRYPVKIHLFLFHADWDAYRCAS